MNLSHRDPESRAAFREQAADAMRRSPTDGEQAMAALLRDMGVAFHEQYPLELEPRGEIADFYLFDHGIIVEVDGSSHKKGPDRRRDARIWQQLGHILVLRFTNKEVIFHPNKVRAKLSKALGW